MKMRLGLYGKFGILFVTVTVLLLAWGSAQFSSMQREQAEREMLEKAQTLAQEMDAVWSFMEMNQNQFVLNEDGTYRMYCVVAAKSVSRLFTMNTDYRIHYTDLTVRKKADAPDEFERQALEALHENPEMTEYYSLITDESGSAFFRYMEPVYITESCLECHGEPEGELDQQGYPKEGCKLGDIAGATSITMPADGYLDNMRNSVLQSTIIHGLSIVVGMLVVFFAIFYLVARPVEKLKTAAKQIENHSFDVDLKGVGGNDEMEDLANHFRSMAEQLKIMYTGLEGEVEQRTLQLEKMNETLEEANRLLQEESQYKSDFLAVMSHELRTPLTSILAFADIWETSYEARDPSEKLILREIRVNSRSLLAIVNNILDMARIDAGKNELNASYVDLVDLALDVRNASIGMAERKSIDLTCSLAEDIPSVWADAAKVHSILENLVSNALKFTDDGGKVEIAILADKEHDEALMRVSDNGRGISKEDLDGIFDRFVQGQNDKARIVNGSGLGLTIVKEMTALHKGRVLVESAPGKGSTFTVVLPFDFRKAESA